MKTKVEKKISIVLHLNDKEAEMLKGIVQNPHEGEEQEIKEFQEALFNLLKDSLEN